MIALVTRRLAFAGAILILTFAGFAGAPAAADTLKEGAHRLVRELADKAISSLTKRETTQTEREAAFRSLLVGYFDVPVIGKLALGRYWRIASKEEQEEYLAIFEEFIVTTYANRFREYTNEHLEIGDVVSTADEDGGLVVHSQIVRDQPKPIRVDWRLAPAGEGYKIVDVTVEGVSMMQTQRSEFSSVIVRTGGKVAGLITELKLKNQSLRAQMNE